MIQNKLDNFLPPEIHKVLMDILCNESQDYDNIAAFPYFFRNGVSYPGDGAFAFGHTLWNDGFEQEHNQNIIDPIDGWWFSTLGIPLVSRIGMRRLLRMKVNCYTRREIPIIGGYHVDYDEDHMVGIYMVNTNNGYTEFENGDRMDSIANTMYIFDGRHRHRGVNQTDTDIRVNINIGFE